MAYVYLHTRLDTNEIFYVGIGNSDDDNFKRSRIKNRNDHWNKIVNKAGYRVDVVYRNISFEKACELEIKLIKLYGRYDLGLGNLVNMTDGGEINKGKITSDETKKKISNSNKGKHYKSEEDKKKISEFNKGKITSDETKKKISEAKKGKKMTDETKLKMSEAKKKMSDETKFKISESRNGKKHSAETKQKMSEKAKNRIISEETKLKMSEAQKGKSKTNK